jgi:hypothetical protein
MSIFGIEESRWIPKARKEAGKGEHIDGRHAASKHIYGDELATLRTIWRIWTFRGGATLIALTFLFALFISFDSLKVVSVIIGTFLVITCLFVFAFQVNVVPRIVKLNARMRRGNNRP